MNIIIAPTKIILAVALLLLKYAERLQKERLLRVANVKLLGLTLPYVALVA